MTYPLAIYTQPRRIPVAPEGPIKRLPPAGPPPVFFTVDEVATRLRVSKMTVYRLYHEGQLTGAVRVGRSIRIPESALDQFEHTA